MKNCLQCNKELTHVEGRKKKSFCNVNCRNKYFYAKNKELVEKAKVVVNNLNEQSLGTTNTVTTAAATTNYFINTNPQTLEDVKKLCPKELTGLERSEWIATERQKHGV